MGGLTAATPPVATPVAVRSKSALGEPEDLTGFPRKTFKTNRELYRAVSVGVGAWWFSSIKVTDEVPGRFDLHPPDGTCYLATDVQTAIRERVGKKISKADLVPETFVASMEVVTLQLPYCADLANTGHKRAADWGTIRELGSAPYDDYSKTARWAAAFKKAGYKGILYGSRFTSISAATAIAFFDKAASKTWNEKDRWPGEHSFVVAKMDHLIDRDPGLPSTSPAVVRSPAPAPLTHSA